MYNVNMIIIFRLLRKEKVYILRIDLDHRLAVKCLKPVT